MRLSRPPQREVLMGQDATKLDQAPKRPRGRPRGRSIASDRNKRPPVDPAVASRRHTGRHESAPATKVSKKGRTRTVAEWMVPCHLSKPLLGHEAIQLPLRIDGKHCSPGQAKRVFAKNRVHGVRMQCDPNAGRRRDPRQAVIPEIAMVQWEGKGRVNRCSANLSSDVVTLGLSVGGEDADKLRQMAERDVELTLVGVKPPKTL